MHLAFLHGVLADSAEQDDSHGAACGCNNCDDGDADATMVMMTMVKSILFSGNGTARTTTAGRQTQMTSRTLISPQHRSTRITTHRSHGYHNHMQLQSQLHGDTECSSIATEERFVFNPACEVGIRIGQLA